jgi:hypothetical protein
MKCRPLHHGVMVSIPSNATWNGRATPVEVTARYESDLHRLVCLRGADRPGTGLAT